MKSEGLGEGLVNNEVVYNEKDEMTARKRGESGD